MSNGEVGESRAPEVVNRSEEGPELDLDVEENFGNHEGTAN